MDYPNFGTLQPQTFTRARISELCEQWCQASTGSDGSMLLGADVDRFRLRTNGVEFHRLAFDALEGAIIGLTRVLLRPKGVVTDFDHSECWAWLGELLLGTQSTVFSPGDETYGRLLALAIRTSLMNASAPPKDKDDFMRRRAETAARSNHLEAVVQDQSLLVSLISFPLLEATLKRACASFVSMDGAVVSAFAVTGRQGGTILYTPAPGKGKKRVSSLRDLLALHHLNTASGRLRLSLDEIRAHLHNYSGALDAFDQIYAWRNQSLHGPNTVGTIGGTLLNYTLLVLLDEIHSTFEQHQDRAIRCMEWHLRIQGRPPWMFYPPY